MGGKPDNNKKEGDLNQAHRFAKVSGYKRGSDIAEDGIMKCDITEGLGVIKETEKDVCQHGTSWCWKHWDLDQFYLIISATPIITNARSWLPSLCVCVCVCEYNVRPTSSRYLHGYDVPRLCLIFRHFVLTLVFEWSLHKSA